MPEIGGFSLRGEGRKMPGEVLPDWYEWTPTYSIRARANSGWLFATSRARPYRSPGSAAPAGMQSGPAIWAGNSKSLPFRRKCVPKAPRITAG